MARGPKVACLGFQSGPLNEICTLHENKEKKMLLLLLFIGNFVMLVMVSFGLKHLFQGFYKG